MYVSQFAIPIDDINTVLKLFRTLMNHQENTQGREKGKEKREVTETDLNGDTAKTKTKTGDLEKGTRSEREAGKNLHEGETFKVCCLWFSYITADRIREKFKRLT